MTHMKRRNKIALGLSAVMAAAGGGIVYACRTDEAFADWYVTGPFQLFPNVIGRLTGCLPFSLYEVILYVLAACLLWRISAGVACLWRRQSPGHMADRLCNLVFFLSMILCIASFTCFANYGRSPLAEAVGVEIQPSSAGELMALCEGLAEDAEAVMDQVERDMEGRFTIEGTDIPAEARKAMEGLGETYEVFRGYYPQPKPVLWSEGMSYINLTGMYSPFTIEANYNAAVTDYVIPYTICHELAHLRGFIREDEAGFIAWLACSRSDNPQMQYSGAVSALRYALSALYREIEPEEYADFYNGLPIEFRWDLWQNSLYWQRHRGKSLELGNKVNDAYLKVNAQAGGVKSYGRMIDLLLAYRRTGAELL